MRFIATLSLMVFLATASTTAFAETVNTGRSDVALKVPASYSESTPLPLVVLLHGYTSSGAGQDKYMKFSELVNEYEFLLLMPDGTVEANGQKNRFWNATNACCNMQNSEVDDSAYLIGLINEVKANYSVDANSVYLIGHSNGGFMSHRMAYDHPDTIAAIVSLAGASPAVLEGPTPNRPVNILQIHGTADATINYAGGQIREVSYPSANDTMEKWAIYNAGGSDKRIADNTLDLDSGLDGEETTVMQFESKGNVALWTIQEGAHVPKLSSTFNRQVIEWLFDHPKTPL
jgi:polyhydroxybutyrate depolymerase